MPRKRRSSFGQIKERRTAAGVSYQAGYNTPPEAFSKYAGLSARQYKTFSDMTRAQGWLASEKKKIDQGIWVPPEVDASAKEAQGVKFKDYADNWLKNRHKANGELLSESTRTKYQELLDNHLLRFFGAKPVIAILPNDVQRWWDSYPKPTAIRTKAYELLSSIMRSAENDPINTQGDTLIERSPCRIKAALPPKKHKSVNVELTQLKELYEAMPESLRLSIFLGGVLGLRIGEVLALRRCDVDLEHRRLHVCGSVKTRKINETTEVFRGKPKTVNSNREVDIPPYLCPLFEEHLKHYTLREKTAPLFPAPRKGGFMRESSFTTRWSQARIAVGLRDLRFHDLRHTALQRLVENGASVNLVMAQAGHSTIATASVYQDGVSRSYEHDVMEHVNAQLVRTLETPKKDSATPEDRNPDTGEETSRTGLQSLSEALAGMDLETRVAVLNGLRQQQRSKVLSLFPKDIQIETMTSLLSKEGV